MTLLFNDTATTEIYTLSLHDALPIWSTPSSITCAPRWPAKSQARPTSDRKSTRLNSSHLVISYAVFCLKNKMTQNKVPTTHMQQDSCYVHHIVYNN